MSVRAGSVGYQGEPGAYSEDASRLLFPGQPPAPLRTLRAVFAAVGSGELGHGIVPLENSRAGSVTETYDLLAAGDVFVVGETVLRIDHALVAPTGTTLDDVSVVRSHPQALAQCQEFLASLDVEVIPVHDTAGAARQLSENPGRGEAAAVASVRAATLYGLDVLARGIQDVEFNVTRFARSRLPRSPWGRPTRPR